MTSANTSSKCRVCICALSATVCSYDMREFPELAHKFVTLTDLALYETDTEKQLPSELCQECFEQLEESYAFRSKCIAADEQWRLELSIAAAEELEKELDTVETVHQMVNEVTELEVHQVEGAAEEAIVAVDINETQNSQSNTDSCNACQHKDLAPYPCTEEGCEQAFNRFHDLTEHLKEHLVTSRFSCEQEGCDKVYRHKPTLTMHMRRCHKLGPELKSHICEFCGKVFNSSTVLNDHRYTHKDQSELPHACQEANCSRRFSTKEKLKVHLMRHAGIKNFSCPYCGLRKTTRNELKIHMNYHTLERTWHCRFCSKVCNSSGNLKMHVRTVHERARDYACRYCERSFAKSDTRKYHEMTHTGEKPFECEECGKRFTQPAALRTHRKVHERQRKDSNTITYTLLLSEPGDTNAASVEQNDEY